MLWNDLNCLFKYINYLSAPLLTAVKNDFVFKMGGKQTTSGIVKTTNIDNNFSIGQLHLQTFYFNHQVDTVTCNVPINLSESHHKIIHFQYVTIYVNTSSYDSKNMNIKNYNLSLNIKLQNGGDASQFSGVTRFLSSPANLVIDWNSQIWVLQPFNYDEGS